MMQKIRKIFSILSKNGILKGIKILKSKWIRKNAFKEMNKKMPQIEKRTKKFFSLCLNWSSTEHSLKQEEKNIFVFWWDGFSNAPALVKHCLAQLHKFYDEEFNIFEIDQFNFEKYTDIPQEIITRLKKGTLTIQTFSDVLRFNLLKNNGGYWVDSTILFTKKFELLQKLEKEPFATISFLSSGSFLTYKNENCSWSGFFIGAKKENALIKTLDFVMCQYLLRYKKRNPYFLIDMIFMLSKLNQIDNGALSKTFSTNEDMFYLMNHLQEPATEKSISKVEAIPQKMSWMLDMTQMKQNTLFYYYLKEVFKYEKK